MASTAVPATAQVHDWTGGTGSWFTTSNWSPASVPPAGETVNITNGGTAQIGAAAGTVRSVTVSGGSTVDLQSGGSLATQFGFSVTAGNGTGTASNGTILLSGSSALTNTIQLVTGTLKSNISAVMANQISLIGNNNLISTASGTTLELNFSSITAGGTAIGGGGTVIYTGDTFYTGPTTINAGSTLQLGSGGAFGSILGGGGIVNSGTLAISHSGTFNQGANVSGTGGITILAANTATVGFTGTNSYSGITDIQGGTLSLNNLGGISATSTFNVGSGTTLEVSGISATLNNLTGSGTVNIRQTDPGAGSTLTLNNANFTGTITQNPVGGVVQAQNLVVGTGTVILAGTNSWVGATTVNSGGTLQLGNGGTGGNIPTGTITNNGTLAINHSDSLTYSGNIGGTGILVKSGTGTLSLTSANSYSGGTAVAGGTLRLGVSGAAGSGSITTTGSVIDYADGISVANPIVINSNTTQLQALAGVTATQSGVISETGGARPLEKIGTGTLVLTGLNSYTGGTTVTAGTLSIGTGGSLDSNGAVTVTGGTFNINGNSITVAALTGTGGTVNIDTGGTLSTYSGANGTLVSLVTGAGRLLKGGTGVYTISNANTFSGGLTIVDGTVLLTNKAAAGTGIITITAPATLDLANGLAVANNIGLVTSAAKLNQTGGTVTLSGVISEIAGVRAVEKTGAGTIILTGANTYSGGTTITAGTLQVGSGGTTGSIAGNVANSGTLAFNRSDSLTFAGVISGTGGVTKAGAGTLTVTGASTYTGATTVSGGTLAVNGSIGSSAVTIAQGATLGGTGTVGATTVQSGGTLAPGNSIGTLSVNGNLTLASGSTYTVELSPTTADRTTVSGAASLNGTLALLPGAGTYTAGTTLTLLSANSVSGTFASVTGLSFPGVKSEIVYNATSVQLVISPLAVNFAGRTPNQIAAAAALNAGPVGNPLQTALSNYLTANPAQMEAVLDSVSGEIHASVRGAALEDSRMIRNTVQVRLDGGAEGAGLWGYGFADYGWLDSDGNAAEATRNNAGFIGGFDMPVMDGLRLGVGGAYMEHKVGVAARGSRAAGSRTSLLAYASYESGPLTVRLGGDYGWGTDNVSRVVAALGETERSRRTNEGGSVFARASYDFGLPVVPYAGITHAAASNGAFTETGGLAALIGGTASENQTYSLLGLNLELGALDLHGMALTPRADIAWSHALDAMATAQSVSLSTGRSFTVLGAPIGTDAAAIQLGLDLAIAPDALFSVDYDGFFSNRGQSNAVRGGFHWKF